MAYWASLFDNTVILASFDFEENRRQGIVTIIAKVQFKTVFGFVACGLICF